MKFIILLCTLPAILNSLYFTCSDFGDEPWKMVPKSQVCGGLKCDLNMSNEFDKNETKTLFCPAKNPVGCSTIRVICENCTTPAVPFITPSNESSTVPSITFSSSLHNGLVPLVDSLNIRSVTLPCTTKDPSTACGSKDWTCEKNANSPIYCYTCYFDDTIAIPKCPVDMVSCGSVYYYQCVAKHAITAACAQITTPKPISTSRWTIPLGFGIALLVGTMLIGIVLSLVATLPLLIGG